jgi:secondary thiamine-phosphate synthase enzyme
LLSKIAIKTEKDSAVEITREVKEIVSQSGIASGLCVVFIPHTTAGLTITSFWDPKGLEDIQDEISRIIPTRIDFKHQHDTPQDAAGHVKSSLTGVTLTLIIDNSQLLLGHSQGIFFLEFDGPRSREYFVKIMKE